VLTAEEARARLAATADGGWKTALESRVGALPAEHQDIAHQLAGTRYDGQGWDAYADWHRRQWRAAEAVDGWGDAERLELMTALSPGLGAALARYWVDGQAQPYQTGYTRRSFRAPRDPSLTRHTRAGTVVTIVHSTGPHRAADPGWLAVWAQWLWSGIGPVPVGDAAARVLAAAIDGAGGAAVRDTLIEIGTGEHPLGVWGRYASSALLRAADPAGWDFVERLLLAARLQEGLRQSVLEAADEAHPIAFIRLLGLVLQHDLLRFAAAVRAAGVWLGIDADVTDGKWLTGKVAGLWRCLTDNPARKQALAGADPWQVYTALCATATIDLGPALRAAEVACGHSSVDVRAAAIAFLRAAGTSRAGWLLVPLLDDPDLAVAALARTGGGGDTDALAELERLAERLPAKPTTAPPIGIEREPVRLARADAVGSLVGATPRERLPALRRWLPAMDAETRGRLADRLHPGPAVLDPAARDLLVTLVGDRSGAVRQAAVSTLEQTTPDPAYAPELEALLTRKAGDLRRGLLGLLARLPAGAALDSVRRLGAAADPLQQEAGCELLVALAGRPATTAAARDLAASFATRPLSPRLRELLGPLLGDPARTDTGPELGLYDPADRTEPVQPEPAPRQAYGSAVAARIISDLDDIFQEHRDVTVVVRSWQGTEQMLLADVVVGGVRADGDDPMLLGDVVRPWWRDRPDELREPDGLDLLHATVAGAVRNRAEGLAWVPTATPATFWDDPGTPAVPGVLLARNVNLVAHALSHLFRGEATPAVLDECLDALQTTMACAPESQLTMQTVPWSDRPVRQDDLGRRGHVWRHTLRDLFRDRPDLFDADRLRRWYRLERYWDQPRPGLTRSPVEVDLLLAAHDAGVATDADVLERLLEGHGPLRELTKRRRDPRHPRALALADRVRDRVLGIERVRGDRPTPASRLAPAISSIEGAGVAIDLWGRLEAAAVVRGYAYGEGREAVYSHLVRVSHPAPGDTGASVAAAAAAAGLPDRRLVDLAMFAPQWTDLVEQALGWPGLADAVWWFHAHTKDEQWSVPREVRQTWAALSAERTPLPAEDLTAGAVDVDWFHRARATLGPPRWAVLDGAAKYGSRGIGHARARLFAQAMLGEVGEDTLTARVRSKRHQDSARALGLLPLPAGADRDEAVLRRYAVLREFERGSVKFGAQRKASERTAARIGVENLARTTGAPDPQRFVWAMEAAEAGDLAAGPVEAGHDGVTVTLSVDAEGVPALSVRRDGRELKSVPAAAKKAAPVAALIERRTALQRQVARMRASLEAAMVAQDPFTPADLAALDGHPVLAPMLRLLVFLDPTGRAVRRLETGPVDVTGTPVTAPGDLRIAHPADLLGSGDWPGWQRAFFAAELRQPFRQVFRELYPLTTAERESSPVSRRYDGHQVQPRQALALLNARGWLGEHEGGSVARTFHRHRLVARVEFLTGFGTPAEAELPTLRGISFTKQGEWAAQPLADVPPVVFSEAMRDLDLVVSVAHAGGVDPEATASTVDMRAALVRETVRLLKLDNVREVGQHVVIEGALGEYSVHLGSGVVHRRPGGAICVIPVDSQRRGRVFLPFADDDPRTAEVVAKVLLLARDREIRDPSILEQLR
jgi:Family of unknown function (DUF5724)/Domain of unknown function (DUF4132)